MGRKNSILVGFTILVIANTALGCLEFIHTDDVHVFFGISLAIRIASGYSDSLISTTQYSIVANCYKEEKTTYIAIIEAATGLGLILGPPIGSAIYGHAGFAWAFFAFSILLALNFVSCFLFIPWKINLKT